MIADQMENNPEATQTATVIWGSEVYQCMDSKKPIGDAARETIFNCNFAINKLMSAAVGVNISEEYDE